MVPDDVWRDLQPDPEIIELEARRDKFKNGRYRIRGTEHEEIRELTKTIRTKRAQREKDLRNIIESTPWYLDPASNDSGG
ncbi:Uncharacterized protein TCAP_03928 [Tolypocladium capitatum]|uniref:Uncharacterized protein n=1 Tax=Tolypocladium capitatum TaxID=45235 RepID=A0A2K3QF19_9HYPO|nr:Uncharacterized protein TCAP_03928 [Tolypocladium capitatum]